MYVPPSSSSHLAVRDLNGLIADRHLGFAPLILDLLGAGGIWYGDLDDVLRRRHLDELALAFNLDRAAGRLEIEDLLLGGGDFSKDETVPGIHLGGQPGHEHGFEEHHWASFPCGGCFPAGPFRPL